jgi:hypothetical protein
MNADDKHMMCEAVRRMAEGCYKFPFNKRPIIKFARDTANAIINERIEEILCAEYDHVAKLNEQE